jgi:outer membrane protein assembly factor BamA
MPRSGTDPAAHGVHELVSVRCVGIVLLLAACSHSAKPAITGTCGAGWAPLTDQHAPGGAASIDRPPDAVIRAVTIEGVSDELATTLRSVVKTHAGQTFADAPVKDDLRRLWALGVLDEASLEARDDVLAFVVAPRPRIAAVEMHAADPDTVRRFALLTGAPYEPRRIARMANTIQSSFVREGRLDAAVTVGQTRRADGVGVCVAVQPGPKVTIAKLTFPGRNRVPEKELMAALHSTESKINRVGGIYDPEAMAMEELYVAVAYWDRGYANVKVGSHRVTRKGAKIVVELPVVEGEMFRLGRVSAPGAVRVTPSIKTGDVFSRTRISDARTELETLLGADVLPLTHVNLEARTIDITFELRWRWPWDAFKRWSLLSR